MASRRSKTILQHKKAVIIKTKPGAKPRKKKKGKKVGSKRPRSGNVNTRRLLRQLERDGL
jgi:hypothetical protein